MDLVYVVERHTRGGYLLGGSYVNTFESEIVGVYDNKTSANKHGRLKNHSVRTFALNIRNGEFFPKDEE